MISMIFLFVRRNNYFPFSTHRAKRDPRRQRKIIFKKNIFLTDTGNQPILWPS